MPNLLEQVKLASPDDAKVLEELRITLETTEEDINSKLEVAMKESYLQNYPETERAVLAAKVVRANCASLLMSDAVPYVVRILGTKAAKTINRAQKGPLTIGSAVGIGHPRDQPTQLGLVLISGFDDVASRFNGLHAGKTYELRASPPDDFVINAAKPVHSLTADETFRATEYQGQFAMPTSVVEFLKKFYPVVPIADVENNLSRKNPDGKVDYTDQKLIIGQIVYARPGSNANGAFGRMEVIDNSLSPAAIKKRGGGFSIMVDPAQLKYSGGTEVACIGVITRREKDGRVYLGMNGDLVIPTSNFFVPYTAPAAPSTGAVKGGPQVKAEDEGVNLSDFN